jgi:HK97 family phage major capsid protein
MSGLRVLEKPALENPGKDVPEALEQLRVSHNESVGAHGATQESLAKLTADVAGVIAAQAKEKEEMRNLLRQVPPPGDNKEPISLRKEELSLRVTSEDLGDKDLRPCLDGVTPMQLSLLVQDINRLTDDPATARKLKRYRFVHDVNAMNHIRYASMDETRASYRGYDSLPLAEEEKALAKMFRGTLSDTTGEGKEFLPALVLSGAIYDRIAINLEVENLFTHFPMTARTVYRAGRGAAATSYFVAEATSNTASVGTPTTINTIRALFTALKQVGLAYESEEWEQDSIAGANEAMDQLAYAFADGGENLLVNGQATATIDGGTVVSDFDGLRYLLYSYLATSGKSAVDMSGGVDGLGLAGVWAGQGKYGQPKDGAWVVETCGLARMMVATLTGGVPLWSPIGGPQVTGALGYVFGRPIVVSSKIPTTLSATGVIPTPAEAYTEILHVCRPAYAIGDRLGVTLAYSKDYSFADGRWTFRAIRRWAFKNFFTATTDRAINAGFGVVTF